MCVEKCVENVEYYVENYFSTCTENCVENVECHEKNVKYDVETQM